MFLGMKAKGNLSLDCSDCQFATSISIKLTPDYQSLEQVNQINIYFKDFKLELQGNVMTSILKRIFRRKLKKRIMEVMNI